MLVHNPSPHPYIHTLVYKHPHVQWITGGCGEYWWSLFLSYSSCHLTWFRVEYCALLLVLAYQYTHRIHTVCASLFIQYVQYMYANANCTPLSPYSALRAEYLQKQTCWNMECYSADIPVINAKLELISRRKVTTADEGAVSMSECQSWKRSHCPLATTNLLTLAMA